MTLFLLAFFFLYSLLHVYAFLKAKAAIGFGAAAAISLILFMLVMITAPVIVRISERSGLETFARLMAYIGYSWLGVLFLFCSASAALDIWHIIIVAARKIPGLGTSGITPANNASFYFSLIFSLLAATYGYFEAWNIHTERLVIHSDKIPEGRRIRIVQISDVHLGLIIGREKLKRIITEIKNADPDIVVSTGDLVDGQADQIGKMTELLRGITPRYGKFAVFGNHEFFAGVGESTRFIQSAGFDLLRGQAVTIDGIINIAGVDDPAGRALGLVNDISEKGLLSGLGSDRFTIFLKHRPTVDKDSMGLFDLQISGHTHKGQIFPFTFFTWLYYPVHAGLMELADKHYLYVSRGSGTWGPPIRFLSPPEIAVIDIVRRPRV